jgi:hypothetical protein
MYFGFLLLSIDNWKIGVLRFHRKIGYIFYRQDLDSFFELQNWD